MIFQKRKFLFLYFLMLVLELLIAWVILSKFGFSFYLGGDSPGYMLLAKNLVEHGTLSLHDSMPYIATSHRTPGYPFFLAIIYLFFHSFIPAIFFGALISAFAASLVYLISREIFSERTAFIAGFLSAVEPLGLFLGVSILTEGVFTSVLLLSVYLFIRYLKVGHGIYLYSSVIFLALATLVRPIMFYFWPIAIPFIIYKELNFGWRQILKKSFVFIAIFFIILGPWLIRNKIVIGNWQITSISGYVFFIDHYGAVLRYLGEVNSLAEVQSRALYIIGPSKVFTSEGSDILFKTAISGIKQHKLAYANVYAKSLIAFFISNSYKSLFIDLLGIPAKAPFIPFELFLRFDFKSILKTLNGMDFLGILIYLGSKVLWVIIFLSFLIALCYLLLKKKYRNIRAEILFLAVTIFYFALITGPTAVGGGRTKAPINGLIFIFAVFGIVHFIEFLRNKFV